jgi:hypothetical protein
MSGTSGPFRILDANTGAEKVVKPGPISSTHHGVTITPDNKRIVAAGVTGQKLKSKIFVWNASGVEERLFEKFTGIAESMAVSSDGRLVAAAINDNIRGGSIRVWDLETGEEKLVVQGKRTLGRHITFGPRNESVIAGFYDGTFRVFDLQTGSETGGIRTKSLSADRSWLTPDGATLITTGSRKLQLWEFPACLGKLTKPGETFAEITLNGKVVAKLDTPATETVTPKKTAAPAGGFDKVVVEGLAGKTTVHLRANDRRETVFLRPETKFIGTDGKDLGSASSTKVCRIGNVVSVKTRVEGKKATVATEIRLIEEGPRERSIDGGILKELGPKNATFDSKGVRTEVTLDTNLQLYGSDGLLTFAAPKKFLKINKTYQVKIRLDEGADRPIAIEIRELKKTAAGPRSEAESKPLVGRASRPVQLSDVIDIARQDGPGGPWRPVLQWFRSSPSGSRLDARGHGSLAAFQERIGAERVDLVALELGPFLRGGVDDDAALRVHFHRDLISLFDGVAEETLHHVDDVVERMVVVVMEDDVIRRQPLRLVLALGPRPDDGFGSRDAFAHGRRSLDSLLRF